MINGKMSDEGWARAKRAVPTVAKALRTVDDGAMEPEEIVTTLVMVMANVLAVTQTREASLALIRNLPDLVTMVYDEKVKLMAERSGASR